jgi:hypothetical protein
MTLCFNCLDAITLKSTAVKRSRSSASEALEISSRRKMSLFE